MMSAHTATSVSTPAPIIFTSQGPPDVRLNVLSQEYHVHSVVLKLHSAYFWKFLDSPDKTDDPPTGTAFKYEWVTKVDEEDKSGWQLVCAGPKVACIPLDQYEGNAKKEIAAFTKLLHALYDLPYGFRNEEQLITMVVMAKFYCCLPRLSRSISAAVMNRESVRFRNSMKHLKHAGEIADAAVELRHYDLLQDVLNHTSRSGLSFDDTVHTSSLRRLVQTTSDRIGCLVSKVHLSLSNDIQYQRANKERYRILYEHMLQVGMDLPTVDVEKMPLLAIYYRKLQNRVPESMDSDPSYDDFLTNLHQLLANRLTFNHYLEAGIGTDYFLCFELKDLDLPWDPTETDW